MTLMCEVCHHDIGSEKSITCKNCEKTVHKSHIVAKKGKNSICPICESEIEPPWYVMYPLIIPIMFGTPIIFIYAILTLSPLAFIAGGVIGILTGIYFAIEGLKAGRMNET